uniref:PAP_RNA-bind domain-containing protein n=1 Tax=Caenorhabditis tropicalis TaxID=1561998 RepID=A0A1I7TJZ8_9PELO
MPISPTLGLDAHCHWPHGDLFDRISRMEYEELWLFVFGEQSKSKEDGCHFKNRLKREIFLAEREVASARSLKITKAIECHISDFLHSLTRGLCSFEERFFPEEWFLGENCCVHHEYSKSKPRRIVIVKIRLHQVKIVKHKYMSLVGKFIPDDLEEDSGTSVFHNVHRFYRMFLGYAVYTLFGYEIQWHTHGDGSVESEKFLYTINELGGGSKKKNEEIPFLNLKDTARTASPSESEQSFENEEIVIENDEEQRIDTPPMEQHANQKLDELKRASPPCFNGQYSNTSSNDQSSQKQQEDTEQPKSDLNTSLTIDQSRGMDLNIARMKEMIAYVVDTRKRRSIDGPSTIESNFGRPHSYKPYTNSECRIDDLPSDRNNEETEHSLNVFPQSTACSQSNPNSVRLVENVGQNISKEQFDLTREKNGHLDTKEMQKKEMCFSQSWYARGFNNDSTASSQSDRYSLNLERVRRVVEDPLAFPAITPDNSKAVEDSSKYISLQIGQKDAQTFQSPEIDIPSKRLSFKIQGRKVLKNTVQLD